jgi:hypothetical protein
MISAPRYSQGRNGTAANQARAEALAERLAPILAEMRGQGLSLRQMAANLTDRGIPARHGGAWAASSIRRILARLAGH